MDYQLIKARLISFGWSLLSLVITTVAGMLLSSDFAHIVQANFGDGATGALVLLVVTEVAKHLRNLHVINAMAERVGSRAAARERITLI